MKLVFASTNKGKIKEIKEILNNVEVLSLSDIGFDKEIVEDGKTFLDNAYIKAKTVYDFCHIPTIADDSGIEVKALNNEPGIYSARYSKTGKDEDNNALLLENLQDKDDKSARYVCAIVYVPNESEKKEYVAYLNGKIIDEYRGSNGFGYDPIFFLEEYGKTTAEISIEEKNRISHRGKALRLFADDFLK